VRRYIDALMPNGTDADDVAQEVRLRLWRQLDEYDRSKDFGAWARTIARYAILTYRKDRRRRSARLSEQYVELLDRGFEAAEKEHGARNRALLGCLEKLSAFQQEILRECYAPGATIKNVATRLGRSVRGMQQTVARLRLVLHGCVERTLKQEDRHE
jgi:RNA polymerase sigma-70 factor (ECF subfamily)